MELFFFLFAPAGALILVGASWLAGGWRDVSLNADTARARLAVDEPSFAADDVLVGADQRAALVRDRTGDNVAAVLGLGDKLVTRRFAPGSIRTLTVLDRPGERILRIDLADTTCRQIVIHLGAAAAGEHTAIADWIGVLNRFAQAPALVTSNATEAK